MKTVLITGSNGQLGNCIREVVENKQNIKFIFKSSSDLDITNNQEIKSVFKSNSFDYCINCAAYTAVDKAEDEPEKALEVNSDAVQFLADACRENNTVLIHISTDFVFDGTSKKPYLETDATNPISIYGISKRSGENVIKNTLSEHFIIRTSWLYSEYGNNFMKTMLRLGRERDSLGVVNDQIGAPTYAKDLANAIITIISTDFNEFGTYHYSNQGNCSWYEFAKEIFQLSNINIDLKPITTSQYPTPAKRPKFSVLNTEKIQEKLQISIPYWKESLAKALENNNNK